MSDISPLAFSEIGADAQSDLPAERPKVIYVMGAGHSGSTILGVALGNCLDFFYAGEVEEWLARSGAAGLGGSERTEFWDAVRKDLNGPQELFGTEANRYVERSSALLRIDSWPTRRRMLQGYRRVAEDLFRAIARRAKATHIVDTSHFPLRAQQLRLLEGIELYLVFLVRDPQDVVASNIRIISRHEKAERRLGILSTNINLWLTQLVSVCVFLRHPRKRRIFVRHEQFLADPEGVLEQILAAFSCSAAVPDLAALRPGVPLQGNKLISSQTISVKRSTRPVVRWSRLTTLLQLVWVPVLSQLRPAATARPAREHPAPAPAPAPDGSQGRDQGSG